MDTKSTNRFFNYFDSKELKSIIHSDISISYKELFKKANQLAFALSKEGINKNDYVALLINDQLEFITSVIALWYLGTVPVPLNYKLLDEEIYSIVEEHNFKFLVTTSRKNFGVRFESLSFGGKRDIKDDSHKTTKSQSLLIINLSNLTLASSSVSSYPIPDLNDESVVIFTSGSTGRPKGVVHTFSSFINSIENSNIILNQIEGDRWLSSLPFYHIGGFQIICRSLFYGCSIIIPDSLKTNDLVLAISKHKPTHLSLVSTQLDRLVNQKVIPDQSLKVSLIGGGFVDDELMFEADKLGWKPYRVYGSTETASMITAISAEEIKTKPNSAGKPFRSVMIQISDTSEILIKSDSLFKEYLNDKKETSAKLINNFYHSGDLGFIDNDGYLIIEARRNDLIVTGGENVNPIEVEKTLLELSYVKEACVFPKQNKIWGQIVAAAIVCNDSSIEEKTIKEYLKKKLAGYKIPKQFFFVDKLPRTSLGKLEREKIRKMF
jgi:O-succinylbenzoic acid--CoA ligase